MARQIDAEGRADAFLALAGDVAAGLLDDAIDHRQAKSGALADFLGGEERFEDLFFHRSRYARAVVRHFDGDVIGGDETGLAEIGAFGGGDVLCRQRDRAIVPAGHGVAGVDHEIDDDLLELVDVGLHQPQVAAVLEADFHGLADKAAQQHLQVRQNVRQLQHLRAQGLAAREGQQLANEAGGAVGVLLDLHDVLEGRVGRPVARQQQVGKADDGGQHIVEVVRYAACQLADGLHLL